MKKVKTKIKSSKLSLKFSNSFKLDRLNSFIKSYQNAVIHYVNYIWNNEISFKYKNEQKLFSIKKDLLNISSYLPPINDKFDSNLSAKALKCASTQAVGIVKAHIDKRRKLLYKLSKFKEENKRIRSVTKKLNKANYNASCNHEVDLFKVEQFLQHLKKLKEFYWKPEGFFNLNGSKLTVSNTKKRKKESNNQDLIKESLTVFK